MIPKLIEWSDANRWAIRKANQTGCLVGIRWNEIFKYYSLSLLVDHERHERQYVTVVEPGEPQCYLGNFIGPWEPSHKGVGGN